MPGGFEHPALGIAAFVAVKLAGYTAAAAYISHVYDRTDLSALLVGGTRLILGVVIGSCWVVCVRLLFGSVGSSLLIALLPARLFEWWLLVWIFYDRSLANQRLGWKVAIAGTVWSCVLDLPAFLGLVAAGRLYTI